LETARDLEGVVEQMKIGLEGLIKAMEDSSVSFQEGYRNAEDYEEARQELVNLGESLAGIDYILDAPDEDEGPKVGGEDDEDT